ncbi:hypothetical protein [Oleiharenicola lentus]|uniref:hypothetical protein n=1 Tax=Oleiharenicola lentus TaxID=2508720 RepID=UPI003F6612EB
MTPAHSETAEIIIRLRQQLILAQVRIMELEDERDQLAPRLAESNALLKSAQALTDRKSDELAHLAKMLGELQLHAANLQKHFEQTAGELNLTREKISSVEAGAIQARDDASKTIDALRSELAGIKSTRSWRWTAWLR